MLEERKKLDGSGTSSGNKADYSWPRRQWRAFALWLRGKMPKGLFARSLLIVILPMALLQTLLAYVFMERHWQRVTHRLSASMAREITALADLYEANPTPKNGALISSIAGARLALDVRFTPSKPLPPSTPKPFFSFLDKVLTQEIQQRLGRPFWVDTIGASKFIEIRVTLNDAQMRVVTDRTAVYASNSGIFLMWMIGSATVLIFLAVLFLRNQVRPIRRLAIAAEAFGRGQDIPYRPSGAREVRQAGLAFVEMKRRVERARDQRMTMLNGVSHDLRTLLTRFRLSLAMLGEGPEQEDLRRDVAEMERILESYLNFARSGAEEEVLEINAKLLIASLAQQAEKEGRRVTFEFSGPESVHVRAEFFRRCLHNVIANAERYGRVIAIDAIRDAKGLTVVIDDDGPGIREEDREAAFRPFHRLEAGRNLDQAGTGLGLAIARDVARAHGGEISLDRAPLGGLRVIVFIPQSGERFGP